MIRGPMTDEEVGDLRAVPDYRLVAWRAPTTEPSAQAGRHTLDLPDRNAMARLAGGVRQMELGVEAIPSLVRRSGVWDLCFKRWPTAAAHWTCCR